MRKNQNFIFVVQIFITLLFLISAADFDFEKDLEYGSPDAKVKALEGMAKTGNKDYIPKISEYLANEDAQIRAAAVRGLYILNARNRAESLIGMLGDPSFDVRAESRRALIAFADFNQIKEHIDPSQEQNAEIRAEAITIIGEARISAAAPVLLKSLKDNDSVRFAAVRALGELSDSVAVDPIRKILKDPVGDIRLQAVKSLVKLRAFEAVPEALSLLEDKDPSVVNEIENVLTGFIAPESELFFTEAVRKDPRAPVRKFSAKALGILADRAAAFAVFDSISDKDEGVRQEAMKSFEILVDNSVVFYLCDRLKKVNSRTRPYIISMIVRTGDPRAVPGLIDQMKREGNSEIRELLQKTAIDISSPTLKYYLGNALHDKNPLAKITAVMIIEHLRLREILPELTKSLAAEKNKDVKIAMLSAVKSILDRNVIPGLNEALVAEKDFEIKAAIMETLKEFKDYSSIPYALACFRTGNDTLSMEAESFLDTVSDMQSIDYFESAIKSANLQERNYALKIVKRFPTAKSLKIALVAAEDKDMFIRRDATQALGQIGDRSAIPVLLKRLGDGEEEIRVEAVKALGQMGDPGIIKYLDKSIFDKSPAVRLEVVKLYIQFGDRENVKLLNKAIGREADEDVKEQISIALKKFGDPSSIPKFRKALFAEDQPNVRREAAMGLGGIGDRDPEIIKDLKKAFKKDQEPSVVAASMVSMAKLGAKEMIPDFIAKLGDSSKVVSDSSKEALEIVLDDSDVNYLAACLQNESEKVRDFCVIKLSKMKSLNALSDIFKILKATSGKTRVKIMGLIEQIGNGEDITQYFLEAMDNPATNSDAELQKWVIKNISGKDTRGALNFLLKSAQNGSADIRLATVNALGKIGSRETQERLRYIAEKDESMAVRNEAKQYLK